MLVCFATIGSSFSSIEVHMDVHIRLQVCFCAHFSVLEKNQEMIFMLKNHLLICLNNHRKHPQSCAIVYIIAYLIHPTSMHLPTTTHPTLASVHLLRAHHHTHAPPTHMHADLKIIKNSKTKQIPIWFMFVRVYVLSAPNHKEC